MSAEEFIRDELLPIICGDKLRSVQSIINFIYEHKDKWQTTEDAPSKELLDAMTAFDERAKKLGIKSVKLGPAPTQSNGSDDAIAKFYGPVELPEQYRTDVIEPLPEPTLTNNTVAGFESIRGTINRGLVPIIRTINQIIARLERDGGRG